MGAPVKFLQLATFSDKYLARLYAENPALARLDYRSQLDFLLQDGFGAGHMVSGYMSGRGYESSTIIANCPQLQLRWAQEEGIVPTTGPDALFRLVRDQIVRIKPDVIYTSDPITFDSRFFRSVGHRPSLVCGWRAASIPPESDFSDFGFMVSNSRVSLQEVKRHGAKASEFFFPGFPAALAARVADTPKAWDAFFCGQWTDAHKKRNRYLLDLTKAPLQRREEFSIGYYLASSDPEQLPAGVAMHNQGELWGLEMYRGIRSGKVVLNATIDYAGDEAGNMRIFEVTGTGSFMLTEHHDNLPSFFTPGTEVETFRSSEELIEKTIYFLNNPGAREDIARRGQQKCFRDFSMEGRAETLDAIIKKYLPATPRAPGPAAKEAPMNPPTARLDHPATGIQERFPGVALGPGIQMLGARNITIGEGSCIGEGTWLNICQRDEQVRMVIGRRVLIGRHSMISTGGQLEIGDFNLFAPRVYISDADHIYADIHRPIIEQGATLDRTLVVQENCWLGINVVVSGNLTIGYGSVLAANSVVLRTVPALCVMAGNPARILKLYNPESCRWEDARDEADQVRILEARLKHPLPEREEYRERLWKNSRSGVVDPILAGGGQHLL